MKPDTFIIRAYGLLFDSQKRLLISKERIRGINVVKFPGGGLEFGEGLHDCILREFQEETGQQVYIIRHFFTTDFFQESAFDKSHQILSVYYLVGCKTEHLIPVDVDTVTETQMSKENTSGIPSADNQILSWIPFDQVTEELFTLPIDKKVAAMLRTEGKATF